MTLTIRPMQPSEYPLLQEFLYEAIFIPEGLEPLPREIIFHPELAIYFTDFGTEEGDIAMVAEVAGQLVGAAWSRIIPDYGHIDDDTPSLSISLYADFRHQGIGTKLFEALLQKIAEEGYKKVSLSVQKANYASTMYVNMGFQVFKETDEDYVMVRDLQDFANQQ